MTDSGRKEIFWKSEMINNKKSTPASNLVKFVKNNYYGLFERKSLGSSVAKIEGNYLPPLDYRIMICKYI